MPVSTSFVLSTLTLVCKNDDLAVSFGSDKKPAHVAGTSSFSIHSNPNDAKNLATWFSDNVPGAAFVGAVNKVGTTCGVLAAAWLLLFSALRMRKRPCLLRS